MPTVASAGFQRVPHGSAKIGSLGQIVVGDIVVVYKIDRLTRSLADFSKMVEVFERQGVSFVSVTQQFNTTTSMGGIVNLLSLDGN